MIPLEEFKKSLPPEELEKLSEEQILKLQEQMDTLASILFKKWLDDRNKKRQAKIDEASHNLPSEPKQDN